MIILDQKLIIRLKVDIVTLCFRPLFLYFFKY